MRFYLGVLIVGSVVCYWTLAFVTGWILGLDVLAGMCSTFALVVLVVGTFRGRGAPSESVMTMAVAATCAMCALCAPRLLGALL